MNYIYIYPFTVKVFRYLNFNYVMAEFIVMIFIFFYDGLSILTAY